MRQVLTIVGSSARAAAVSAARSGFIVHAADLFADVDLGRVARRASLVDDYPAGLGRVIRGTQPGAWLYTGALENHPDLIDTWASQRPLWGNAGDVLRRVRDPVVLAAVLETHGIRAPSVMTGADRVPTDGSWLAKPLRSAGGLRISNWRGHVGDPLDPHEPTSSGRYFQQRMSGQPHSAVYVMADGRAALLGVTEQLIGCSEDAGENFRYRGSVGPIELLPHDENTVNRIGSVLADAFHLTGLVGIDFILNAEGVWPVEVNPRLTASVEVLERACRFDAVQMHANACERRQLPSPGASPCVQFAGKEIVFAPERLRFSYPSADALETGEEPSLSSLADIPRHGAIIEAGWPIATVLATRDSLSAVHAELKQRAARLLRRCTMQPKDNGRPEGNGRP